jgi:hypothetical protein
MSKRIPLTQLCRQAAQVALKRTADVLDVQFTSEISDPKWNWPRQPSPRDIVDTGRLRASQTRTDTAEGIRWSWGTNYSAQVHEGGKWRNGMELPARPWTQEPMSGAQQLFDQQFRRALEEVARD